MSQHKPAWMTQEESRAEELADKGETVNNTAPRLERVTRRVPARKQKALYVQDKHAEAFEKLVLAQKRASGKKAPELAEEAFELLLSKYDVKL